MDDLEAAGWADDVAEAINARTRQGLDATGGQMPILSPRYAIIKGSSMRDLTETGSMLDAMTSQRKKDYFLILFLGGHPAPGVRTAELMAIFHQFGTKRRGRRGTSMATPRVRTGTAVAGSGVPATNFFGFTSDEEATALAVGAFIFEKATLPRISAALEAF